MNVRYNLHGNGLTMGVLQFTDVATGYIVVSKIANQDILNMELLVVNRQ